MCSIKISTPPTTLLKKLFFRANSYFFDRQAQRLKIITIYVHTIILASLLFCSPPCQAAPENFETINTPRFTLYIETNEDVQDNEKVRSQNVASEAIKLLNANYEELTRIFSAVPQKKVILRFLSPDEFRRATGAPAWTSAMYYRGEISIPMQNDRSVQMEQLKRSLRHEYVHAIVAELSGNRCPAWLDEGIAQILEGQANPILGPALRQWLTYDNPIPLAWLENGFTTLDKSVVPPAYAQSLFATRTLINSNGFASIRNYLSLLQFGASSEEAFSEAFGSSLNEFESQLQQQLRRWAASTDAKF